VTGYDAPPGSLAGVDVSPLRGKRIALDPGHGGFFRGALGVNGLTEAEVNLGVALHLWGLLRGAGVEVMLTRTDERDFLSPDDSTLRADLAERVRLAEGFRPDLFLSIHHNADARGLRTINETQTYYKLGDEGPSLDVAQSLHRRLVGGLGITPHRLMPGNYFVLRNTSAPAVLTEASYLTNPNVEERLQLAAKQRLEAQSLFLGLVDYFATPAPVVEELVAARAADGPGFPAGAEGRPPMVTTASPLVRARVVGTFDRAELTLDGEPLAIERRGGRLVARPRSPLAPGPHRAELRVRLSGSRAARPAVLDFRVVTPAAVLAAAAAPPAAPATGQVMAVRLEARDPHGQPIPDSLRMRVRARGASPAETVVVARGEAWTYLRVRASARARGGSGRGTAPAGVEITATLMDSVPGVRRLRVPAARLHVPLPPAERGYFASFLTDEATGLPLRGARLAATVAAAPDERGLSPDGFFWCALDDTGGCELPELRGYRPVAGSGTPAPLRWSARLGGALIGRRIVLDPEGGGEDAAGVGPSGTRAAGANLELARALSGYLEQAGAQVTLTRDGDFAISEVERVQSAERAAPHRVLRIGHPAEVPRFGHYFASAVGRRWAQATGAWMERLGLGSTAAPVEDAQYVLQQTSCPALYVAPFSMTRAEDEARLGEPGFLRREAYAIMVALAADLLADAGAPPPAWEPDSVRLLGPDGMPEPRVLAEIGGLLHQADSAGVLRFAHTEPGDLAMIAYPLRGSPWRVHLLDSSRGSAIILPARGE
jgi:N-acetylmuramoyl-L-alanine amidase